MNEDTRAKLTNLLQTQQIEVKANGRDLLEVLSAEFMLIDDLEYLELYNNISPCRGLEFMPSLGDVVIFDFIIGKSHFQCDCNLISTKFIRGREQFVQQILKFQVNCLRIN